jgi:2,5-furandicarboxylate decarboxylase 1
MAQADLGDLGLIIERLEQRGRLIRVKSEVDPVHDLAGVAARLEGRPAAVLFERVRGHDAPVFTGLYWSRALLADLLEQPEKQLPAYVSGRIKEWQQKPMPPVVIEDGPVLEVTENRVDLSKLPVPTHALQDGGPYFDAAVVIAKDPETGVRNASIQRFMVVARDRMNINIDAGRHLETYLAKAAGRGESLPFTLNVGVGPGVHFAAATPSEAAPIDTDELGIASAFQGAPLELVPSTRSAVEMIAHAMYALECEMIPGEVDDEGPFAEVTGYYARRAPRPVVHIKAIHHRKQPVFQTILSGVEVWNSVGLLGEANVLTLVQRQVPGVKDVFFSHGGCGFYHCVVAMRPVRAGWSKQAIMATFAAFPPLKMVTVVDDDVDIRNPMDVEWAMTTRLDPLTGVITIPECFGHGLNPSFPNYLGTKIGFDCTRPCPYTSEYDRAAYKEVSLDDYELAGGGVTA